MLPTSGDPVPWFTAPTSGRPDYQFSTVAGRYVVLHFVSSSESPEGKAVVAAVNAKRHLFNDSRCAFFGVTADPIDQAQQRVKDDIPGVRWFYDPGLDLAKQFGAVDQHGRLTSGWLLLDPMLRVIVSGATSPTSMIDLLSKLPMPESHAGCEMTAPVLLMPRVFEPSLCRSLIEFYQKEGGTESGFMVERNGKTVLAVDAVHKRRFDCVVDDEALRNACQWRAKRRLVPEIAKAFQFQATRMERYIVGCYAAGQGGYFRPHRDNTTRGTAHRRFAVTINLNAEEYEGGELRFPEFGQRTYKPPTGGAVVFSCSLLHEALPVVRGTRYAFLPFLYDETAAELRERNNPYLSEEIGEYNREG
jgi:peroxiredoxin